MQVPHSLQRLSWALLPPLGLGLGLLLFAQVGRGLLQAKPEATPSPALPALPPTQPSVATQAADPDSRSSPGAQPSLAATPLAATPATPPAPQRLQIQSPTQVRTLLPEDSRVLVRVAVVEGASSLVIGTSTTATVTDQQGRALGQIAAMTSARAQVKGQTLRLGSWQSQTAVWVEPSAGGYVYIGNRWYRGRLLLSVQGAGLLAVNYVNMRDYLYGVIGSEMPASWPLEALKAQAVAARSYALNRLRSASAAYDLGATAADQVYGGLGAEYTSIHQAVSGTASQVLVYQGEVAEAVYSASSGGHTESAVETWGRSRPYLQGVPDFDWYGPNFQWTKNYSQADLSRLLPGVGNVLSVAPTETTSGGRVVNLKLTGDRGSRALSGSSVQAALDLPSTLFRVRAQPLESPAATSTTPPSFQVIGRGHGHGVGMSQWGAYALARHGYNYKQILGYYYRGVQLTRPRKS